MGVSLLLKLALQESHWGAWGNDKRERTTAIREDNPIVQTVQNGERKRNWGFTDGNVEI